MSDEFTNSGNAGEESSIPEIVDFRSLADGFSEQSQGLDDYERNPNHPALKNLRNAVYFDTMDEADRKVFENYYINTGKKVPIKDAAEAMQLQRMGKVDRSALTEKFYLGLMSDNRIRQYLQEKKADPRVTAKYFYENYVHQYEPENIKKMERAFRALMNEPEYKKPEKPLPHFTQAQVEKMSREEIRKNYEAIQRSQKKWGTEKLGKDIRGYIERERSAKAGVPFTREQVAAMTREEIKKNYDAIMKSMKHWK